MNPLTLEWVGKAEGDFITARREMYSDLMALEGYALKFRYPGETADKVEAKAAYNSAQAVRAFIRARLGFPD